MIKSSIVSLVISFCLLIVETALLSNITVLPAVPDLLLLCLLFIAFYNGSVAGEVHGFFSGLFLDFLSAAPLGLNSLMRTIIGFLAGLFKNNFNADKIFIPAILASSATLFKALALFVISFFYGKSIATYQLTESVFWIELGMNTILAPLVFRFLDLFQSVLIVRHEDEVRSALAK